MCDTRPYDPKNPYQNASPAFDLTYADFSGPPALYFMYNLTPLLLVPLGAFIGATFRALLQDLTRGLPEAGAEDR